MASRWLREFATPGSTHLPEGQVPGPKAMAMFLERVMGFTFQSTNCGAGRSFDSVEKSGVGGSFGGADWIFTAPGGSFATTDAAKWLVVRDDVNPRNGGIYKIRKYISATQVEIDFRADYYCEWPTASTGLSWWVFDAYYQSPANGEYIRLQSRHVTGWAIELTTNVSVAQWYVILSVRVAIDGNWAGTKILPGGGNIFYMSNNMGEQCGWGTWNIEGDYDGEWLHLWMKSMAVMAVDKPEQEQGVIVGITVARIDPIEPGHSNSELIALFGCNTNNVTYYSNSFYHHNDNNTMGHGRVWNDLLQTTVDAYFAQSSLGGYAAGFTDWDQREPNERIGGKVELLPGSIVVSDPLNASGAFSYLGRTKGHYTSKNFGLALGDYSGDYRLLPMTKTTRRDLLMLQDGWCIAWPGVTPQW